MRLLLTTSTFPTAIDDGLPRFVHDLASGLAVHHRVTVLVPDPAVRRPMIFGDLDVRRFTYFWPRRLQRVAYGHGLAQNLRSSWLARLQLPGFLWKQVRSIRRIVRTARVELVHSHWIVPQGLCAALARGRRRRFAHVVTLHGGDAYLLRRMPAGRALARFILKRTDRVVAVSESVRAVLDETLGRPSGATILPMGVDVARFAAAEPAASPFAGGYLAFVGRLHPIKGVDVLIRALLAIRARRPDLGVVVIGQGPAEDDLRRLARSLGVDEAVAFLGPRAHERVASYLAGARLVIVPSIRQPSGRTEGTPTVVLEAMAAGTPVVASRVGGVGDVLRHGENGWLCEPGDVAGLAETVEQALAGGPSAAVRSLAREDVRGFDWARVAARHDDLYAAALESGAGGPR